MHRFNAHRMSRFQLALAPTTTPLAPSPGALLWLVPLLSLMLLETRPGTIATLLAVSKVMATLQSILLIKSALQGSPKRPPPRPLPPLPPPRVPLPVPVLVNLHPWSRVFVFFFYHALQTVCSRFKTRKRDGQWRHRRSSDDSSDRG